MHASNHHQFYLKILTSGLQCWISFPCDCVTAAFCLPTVQCLSCVRSLALALCLYLQILTLCLDTHRNDTQFEIKIALADKGITGISSCQWKWDKFRLVVWCNFLNGCPYLNVICMGLDSSLNVKSWEKYPILWENYGGICIRKVREGVHSSSYGFRVLLWNYHPALFHTWRLKTALAEALHHGQR